MKTGSIVFLKVTILLIAIGTLAGMIRFPQTEGRAAYLDLISIYKDPFIIYLYIASIPFFGVLFQAFKLLDYGNKNNIFSKGAVKSVRNIKYCALAFIGFLAMAILSIRLMAQGDDPAGPTMLGLIAIFISGVIATAATVFEKRLQNVVGNA